MWRRRRRGAASAARLLAEVIARAEALGLRQMIAVIGDAANLGSIRLHERLGFSRRRAVHRGRLEARALAGLGPDAAAARTRQRRRAVTPARLARGPKEKEPRAPLASAAQVQGGNAQEVRYGMCMPQCKNMGPTPCHCKWLFLSL